MRTKTKKTSYAEELNHLSVCALLYLAINGFTRSSPLYQSQKLHKWLLTAKKRKTFSILVASDIDVLLQRVSKNMEIVSTLWALNQQYNSTASHQPEENGYENALFDVLKTLETTKKIKSIFVNDNQVPIKGKRGERKIVILESHFSNIQKSGTLSLFLIGDIKSTVIDRFTQANISSEEVQTGCKNGVVVNQINIFFNENIDYN